MSSNSDRWFNLYGRPVTRRDFIRVGRDVAGCLALAGMPAYPATTERFADPPFTTGVASGDPDAHSVVLWTRLDRARLTGQDSVEVKWEIAHDEKFRRIVRRGSSAAPSALGYSVHAEVGGLEPARDYWYRFMAGGQESATGRTRTTPNTADTVDKLRFAFISCQNYEHGYYTVLRHLADDEVDVVIHLGDYIYERRYSPNLTVREHESGEVFTLDQYRGRYAHYRSDPNLQAAHAAHPWIVTTDDHEVSNDYADAIAEVEIPRDQFLLRRAAAYQTYYEFMPLRRSSMPRGPAMQIYRRLSFGRLAQFHVLDTRQYRTDQPCGAGRKPRCADAMREGATMMGPAQERWLREGLQGSKARWNVLANQVMIAQTKQMVEGQAMYSMDRWDGYVAARDRLLRFLDERRPSNPIVITGDIHSNWVADLKVDFDAPASPIVGTEFVGTSVTSGGDGSDAPSNVASVNPHVKFYNSRRGYVRVALTPDRCTADYRVVPFVSKTAAPIETLRSFIVENGRPGALPA
jgi:alkaline phosphatase D